MKRVFIIFFLIVCALFSFYTGSVLADVPAVPDPRVPCDETSNGYKNPEFNSLRPYQASPCRSAPVAVMCSNNITVTLDSVHTRCSSLDKDGNCPYDGKVEKRDVVISLEGVKLPILGNTQDNLDDAQKVNEYASWYLAGTSQKAETGTDSIETSVNFSGPAKKLLPSAIQEWNRFKSLQNAGVSPEFTENPEDAEGMKDLNPKEDGIQVKETDNHNQIVVCTQSNPFTNILNIVFDALNINVWFGSEKPIPCDQGGKTFRLHQWWDSKYAGYGDSDKVIKDWDGSQEWGYRVPPFPWQFSEDIYYQKAYNEWRGKKCILDTIINIISGKKLLCTDIRWKNVVDYKSNVWSDLYQYIPLSNTTDRRGKEEYGGATISASGGSVMAISESQINPNGIPQLFFPHTTEVAQAVKNLNKTFVPSKGVNTTTIPQNTEENTSSCQILDVRTNDGDDLTFSNTQKKHQINFTATYQLSSVGGCKPVNKVNNDPPVFPPIPTPTPRQIWDCNASVTASISLTTLAPELDSIWENSTAGSASTFRKIFPKVEAGAPVYCVADIPGVSPANYALAGGTSPGVTNLVVKNPPSSTSTSPEIYFPHLGSVYEYFLKGIQTALRPQGFGEPITNGTQCASTLACGELPETLPKASGSCALGSVSSRVGTIPKSLRDIINAAAETYKVPPNLIIGLMYGESRFNKGGAYDWNETNVKNWATCQKMPNCNSMAGVFNNIIPISKDDWDKTISKNIRQDLLKIDPLRTKPDGCNLLDGAYGVAWMLSKNAVGSGFPIKSCFGIDLNTGTKSSAGCNWNDRDFETAIKIHESGRTDKCLTKPGSCATGGGYDASCPSGGDTCETVHTIGNTSHNACVWDVAHGK